MCALCTPRGCTVTRWRKGREPLTNADETVLTGRYCFELNSLLRGSVSWEEPVLSPLKALSCRAIAKRGKVLSLHYTFQNMESCWLWPLKNCIEGRSFSCTWDTEYCAPLKALSQSAYQKSQEHTLPKLGGEKGENARESEATETPSQVKVSWAKQIKPHSVLKRASSSTAPTS